MRCSQQYKQRMLEHGHIICSENSKTPLFEFELALLVGLQVVSSKGEEEGGREGELSDKFFSSLSQKPKQGCRTGWKG